LDTDWPDGRVPHLNVAGEEGIHLLGGQDKRVMALAQTGLAEKKLCEGAFDPEGGVGWSLGGRGVSRPG
jgi:hypothetical protein